MLRAVTQGSSSNTATVYGYVYAGNPNGHVAGTAGSPGGPPPTVCWDSTDGEWWICTTTGSTATAVWVNEALVARTLSGATTITGTVANSATFTGGTYSGIILILTGFILSLRKTSLISYSLEVKPRLPTNTVLSSELGPPPPCLC